MHSRTKYGLVYTTILCVTVCVMQSNAQSLVYQPSDETTSDVPSVITTAVASIPTDSSFSTGPRQSKMEPAAIKQFSKAISKEAALVSRPSVLGTTAAAAGVATPAPSDLAQPQSAVAETSAAMAVHTWAQFCAAADVRTYCKLINEQPILAQYYNGSQEWFYPTPLTAFVPTDSAYRAAVENQVSASVRKDNPLLEAVHVEIYLSSIIRTPVPMRSGTVYQSEKEGPYGRFTYVKVGSKAGAYRTAAPKLKGDIIRTSTILEGNMTLVVHDPMPQLPDFWYGFQKGLQHFGCSLFDGFLRRYPTQLYKPLSGQVVWDTETRYPLLLAPTDQAIRTAMMLNPKMKFIFKKGGQQLLDILRYHLLPGVAGIDSDTGATTNALDDIFSAIMNPPGSFTKRTALSGKNVTFMATARTGASGVSLGVLASSDKPGIRPSPIVRSRAFTAPTAQVIVIDRFLLP